MAANVRPRKLSASPEGEGARARWAPVVGTAPFASRPARGFTLIELMVVVLLMSVLATIGISSYRRHLAQSKNTEALAMLRSVSAAQERFRADTGVYLDVSGNLSNYYPPNTPRGSVQHFWGWTHGTAAAWQTLAPEVPELVGYSYATTAGLPFSAPGAVDSNIPAGRVTWPAAATISQPWYAVSARGDSDGDGTFNYMVTSSLSSKIFQVEVGE